LLTAVAHSRGLCTYIIFEPGAYAPGFMLKPASRAEAYWGRAVGLGLGLGVGVGLGVGLALGLGVGSPGVGLGVG
jgi:hypothetical protein